MAIDILGSIGSILGGAPSRKAGAYLGETEEGTRAALGVAIPALLASLMRSGADSRGASELLGKITGPGIDSGIGANLAGLLGDRGGLDSIVSAGQGLLGPLLGHRTSEVAQAVAQTTGVKPSSAAMLLGLAAPVLFGFLKRQVTERHLDAGGLRSMLSGQRQAVQKAGLDPRITGALGFGNLDEMLDTPGEDRVREAYAYETTASSPGTRARSTGRSRERGVPEARRGWLPWLLALGLGALALVFLWNRPGDEGAQFASATSVYFEPGEASLDAGDLRALQAIAVSARTSDASVELTGYAEQTGAGSADLTLARDRTEAVRDALISEGVSGSKIVTNPPKAASADADPAGAQRVAIALRHSGGNG